MSEKNIVFVGIIISPNFPIQLTINSGYLVVENGKITRKGSREEFNALEKSELFLDYKIVYLDENQFLMPGFVDCHTHAPQFPNLALGLDRPLLEWLDKYTFPLEGQYGDIQFAAKVYSQVVQRLLKNGTTTACYFGSLHLDGTLELVRNVIKYQQRALVGKVSMNVSNEAGYYNDTQKELSESESFVQKVVALNNNLVCPIITPRFALSCDEKLMCGLSKIADKYGCRIQTHISENLKEIEHVLETNPNCKSYADVYDRCNLLNNKCIVAHAVYLTDEEVALLAEKRVSIAHCPASNTRLMSGLCPVRKYLEKNITVGLGTDVSGGDSATILDAMRRAMDVSTHLKLQGGAGSPINWKEALYLATLGGAKALNLDDKIGSLEVGKHFDALLVDVFVKDGPIDRYKYSVDGTPEEYAASLVQRFVYSGDDRNIVQVFVNGNRVKNVL